MKLACLEFVDLEDERKKDTICFSRGLMKGGKKKKEKSPFGPLLGAFCRHLKKGGEGKEGGGGVEQEVRPYPPACLNRVPFFCQEKKKKGKGGGGGSES